MVVDVVGTVAVIAVALGAVAELHIRFDGVGDAAHRALMEITPRFLRLFSASLWALLKLMTWGSACRLTIPSFMDQTGQVKMK